MLRSILSVFTGAFGMIFRVILIIILCFTAGYCLFSMLAVPFVWAGLVRLAGIAVCVFFVRFLIRSGRDDDGPADGNIMP